MRLEKIILIWFSCLASSCADKQGSAEFVAQRLTQSATISISDSIEKVFPLFGAYEEKKWFDGWDPVPIYPREEIMQEGTSFQTSGHSHGVDRFVWVVSKYSLEDFLIEYQVHSQDLYWTINILCKSNGPSTQATITYTRTGLSEMGNKINQRQMKNAFERNLEDWELALNHYLKTGEVLKR